MKKRVIACMTGTRADYPRVKPVLREIRIRPTLELKLIVTGSHLVRELGYTAQEILNDGLALDYEVPIFDNDDSPYGMAKAAARCSMGVADALKQIQPELFLITVDRIETLAAAMCGALMNVPIAHIQGGEVTGTIDESIRHAVTKLSQIHFPATYEAAERIIKMGEDPKNVHAVGCPYLDVLNSVKLKSKLELAQRYGFQPDKRLVLFTQHPVTTEYGQGLEQTRITLDALLALVEIEDLEVIALASNADAGGREINEVMRAVKRFHLFPNIPSDDFLALMSHAALMIGNSSAGIREAPTFKLPVVNIGSRQAGRLRAANVIDVPHDRLQIELAIKKALRDGDFREKIKTLVNPYGDGHSAKRIVDILERVELTPALLQKRICY